MNHFHRIFKFLALGASCLLVYACEDRKSDTLFVALPSGRTNIGFVNRLTQTESFNIIEYLYFYNGGGVAAGDINNDGLVDLYFSSNQSGNRLYLNKGDFVFEDITAKAGVAGEGNWKTGVTMADVNGDGYLDIFACGVGNYKQFNARNQLFINNRNLTFTDMTSEYSLSFQGFSTHASFFDYDNDGDLDMYLLNHSVHTSRSYGHSRLRFQSDPLAGDRFYRNELVPEGKVRFTEVTSRSGIYNSQVAYGLGIGVSDLNMDGFMDIYVGNDFHENDYLYINKGNGTFMETVGKSMSHVSRFSMGNDIADINHDGLPDVITLDMLPRDEAVIKTTAGEDPFEIYEFKLRFGYHHQISRNALQLNQGVTRDGTVLFSDIAPLAGVEASDWSWAPLLADFDNDGSRDLFISNGILTRPNDLDYINFISTDSAQRHYGYEAFIRNMPSGKVPNQFFRNTGNLTFRNDTKKWIGVRPSLSNGAAYADLDNDGDLDLVVNNINEEAFIFRNDLKTKDAGWLQFELQGEGANTFGIGARVIAFSGEKQFYSEQMLSRGWQSSVSPVVHMGIGPVARVDSVCVVWPDRSFQMLTSVRKNQRIKLYEKDATGTWDYRGKRQEQEEIMTPDTIPFIHREDDFNGLSQEKLIPHMVSTQGPCISTGDMNGDGFEDFFVGGAAGQPGELFFQTRTGNFSASDQPAFVEDSLFEDVGSAILDADGNGTPDLVVVSGGQEHSGNHHLLLPRLYLNDGSGRMLAATGRFPEIFLNASCVRPADVDGDQDLDLFIGGRVVAKEYGVSPHSFLLINDGNGMFTDGSSRLPSTRPGMVTDAVWADLDNDGRPDLVLVGEWMPVTVLMQDSAGNFQDKTREYGMENTNGWWNTILSGDFDKDGDMDFVAGNLGLNSRLRASAREPVTLYAGDIDHNGGMDHLLTYFNQGVQYPFISRDQLVKQVPSFRREFLKYSTFGSVRREDIIPSKDTARYTVNHAYCFSSVYLENRSGKFLLSALPIEAQVFPVFSFASGDFNADGHADLISVGNLYAVQPDFGRYDAGYGLMMLGDGTGHFRSLAPERSGFIVGGEGREIGVLRSQAGKERYVVTRNNGSILIFENK